MRSLTASNASSRGMSVAGNALDLLRAIDKLFEGAELELGHGGRTWRDHRGIPEGTYCRR